MAPGARAGHRLAFAALAFAIVAWTVVMSALEPVMLDGWFVEAWRADGRGFADYVRANWSGEVFWGNPRLGQWATWVTYDPRLHVIVTPLLVLALFLGLVAHLRGRWPDPARDAWALLVVVGLAVLAQPQLGPVLFYRPFTANYVVGFVIQLAWLLPYRFVIERPPAPVRPPIAIAQAVGMLVLGAAAGACNEHTGPALALAGIVVCAWAVRRRRLRPWMVAGVVGFVAGYALMMLAPAQATRYCGIGAELSLVERLASRSAFGTLMIVGGLAIAGRWMWAAAAVAWLAVRTQPPRAALAWIALGAVVSLTLLASPKQGDRLQFAALAFASLGVAVFLDHVAAARPRLRQAIAVVALGALGFAMARSITIAARVSAGYAERRATLAAAAPGSIVRVRALRDRPSRWFLGDDLPSDALRHRVAQLHGLAAIDLDGRAAIPYQFEIRYALAGDGTRTAPRFLPLQQCEARREFAAEVEALRAQHGAQLAAAELAIVPREPVLDGIPLASSRWRDGRLIAPRASVVNELYTRWITVDRGGLEGPLAVTLIGPGRVLRLTEDGGRYPYRPWQNGTYWVVTCAGADCYLAEVVRHNDV